MTITEQLLSEARELLEEFMKVIKHDKTNFITFEIENSTILIYIEYISKDILKFISTHPYFEEASAEVIENYKTFPIIELIFKIPIKEDK